MPKIQNLSAEEIDRRFPSVEEKSKKEITNEDIDNVASLLREALKIYKSKMGSYKPGYFKSMNERKVRSSAATIISLLEYYVRYDSLTPNQYELAKKLIRNGFNLLK